jgi:dTMP kinase
MSKRGKLAVIEGGDGAGKATQTKMALNRIQADGGSAVTISFPQYGKPSAAKVEAYLRGEYGPKEAISAQDASKYYAEDRAAAKDWIEAQLAAGVNVICDRWVPSNMAHQGAKIADAAERAEFFRWLDAYEYEALGIPRPDLVLVLSVAPATRDANVEKKDAREYLHGGKKDVHEGDMPYQERVERVYRQIAETLPGYVLIDCMGPDGGQLHPHACHELVWPHIERLLKA